MFEKLCAGHEMEILLLLVILVISIGKGSGMLLLQLLKKLVGKEVNINFASQDRADMAQDRQAMAADRKAMGSDRAILAGKACLIPENCPKHDAEHERSLQNQKDIAAMKIESEAGRNLLWKELKATRKGITCIINGLLAKQIIDPRDIPRED